MRLNKILPANFLLVAILVLSCSFVRCQADNNQEVENDSNEELDQEATTSTTTKSPSTTAKTSTESLKTTTEKSTVSTTTQVDYVEVILKTKESNLEKIYELLRKEQANKCIYGQDPKLEDLCPRVMNTTLYGSDIPNLSNLRLSDVRERIISDRIVKSLIQTCPIGEWCLSDNILSLRPETTDNSTTSAPTTSTSLAFLTNSKLFCLINECFGTINYYVQRCVENDLTSHVVQLSPHFCNFEFENTQNDFCVENSLRLLHVSAAFTTLSEEVKLPSPDVCRNEINKNECSAECRKIATSVNKLTSCCGDTKLIKNFKSLGWYFDNYYDVKRTCDLPIKSICLSEGKYYLGISPRILVVSIITSVLITSFVVSIAYILCCRRRRRGLRANKVYESSADLYEYAHLNPCAEDENISLTHASIAEEFGLNEEGYNSHKPVSLSNVSIGGSDEKASFLDMNNNNNNNNNAGSGSSYDISRFVNKHQTDIRGLLN